MIDETDTYDISDSYADEYEWNAAEWAGELTLADES